MVTAAVTAGTKTHHLNHTKHTHLRAANIINGRTVEHTFLTEIFPNFLQICRIPPIRPERTVAVCDSNISQPSDATKDRYISTGRTFSTEADVFLDFRIWKTSQSTFHCECE